ncbi:hypothetical protein [Brevibacillus ruminantium]|nr:hypothetical protein [Brevibacillus ruminantium]
MFKKFAMSMFLLLVLFSGVSNGQVGTDKNTGIVPFEHGVGK